MVLIFKFKSVTRLGCEFLPKIADFGVFDWFLVILNLNHLATLQKLLKSQNYQIFKVSPDLEVGIPKNPQKSPILAFLTNFWWFWIWTIWQHCRNGQNYQISQCCQIWMWISPKIPKNCQFWRFWPILGKKRYGTSGDNVRTQ